MHTHVHIHIHLHIHLYIYMYTHTHMYNIHTYIHTCISHPLYIYPVSVDTCLMPRSRFIRLAIACDNIYNIYIEIIYIESISIYLQRDRESERREREREREQERKMRYICIEIYAEDICRNLVNATDTIHVVDNSL